jgi:cell division protein FtsB
MSTRQAATLRRGVLRRAAGRVTARAAILAVVVLGLLVATVFPLRTYLAERSRIGQLTRQSQALEVQNRKLEHRIRRLHDPHYLQRLARECLGMVKPGEVPFVVVPKGGGPKPAPC